MVLGGGSCQLNLIKRIKAAGHFTVVADYLPDCPGGNIADVHVPVSTFDIDGVTKAAKQYGIEAVVTLGTDQPVFTAAAVAEKLGLHFYIGSKTAKAVTNKRVMKKVFEKHNIPFVPYRLIGSNFTEGETAGLHFPAVLKPVDSQGQRGIFLVADIKEARQRIGETLSYSRESKALLEEYYKSDEITVNGWVDSGKTTLISVVDRITIKESCHIGICLCHHFPSVHLQKFYTEIEEITNRIVSAFDMQNGPLYFQYLIGSEGIKVNEIAMRVGGAYEDITIPLISGIDILGMILEYAEKGACSTTRLHAYSLKDQNKFLSTQLFFCKPGKAAYITPGEEILNLPGVHAIHYNFHENCEIPPIENATARAGYMVIEGESFEDMIDNINRVFERMEILDADKNNLVIPYSAYKNKYYFFTTD